MQLVLSVFQELKKKQKPVVFYEENLRKESEEAKKDISFFRKQLEGIDKKKHELYEYILDLRKQRGGISDIYWEFSAKKISHKDLFKPHFFPGIHFEIVFQW